MPEPPRRPRSIQVSIYSADAAKPLYWVGASLARIRSFPPAARRRAGHELYRVQCGLDPGDWKPMRTVGPGVIEIRVHAGGEHRVMVLANRQEAIYVLHAFEKRTRKTRRADLEVARRNLAAISGQEV